MSARRKRGVETRRLQPGRPVYAVMQVTRGFSWAAWASIATEDDFDLPCDPDGRGFTDTEEEAHAAALALFPDAIMIGQHHARPGRRRRPGDTEVKWRVRDRDREKEAKVLARFLAYARAPVSVRAEIATLVADVSRAVAEIEAMRAQAEAREKAARTIWRRPVGIA